MLRRDWVAFREVLAWCLVALWIAAALVIHGDRFLFGFVISFALGVFLALRTALLRLGEIGEFFSALAIPVVVAVAASWGTHGEFGFAIACAAGCAIPLAVGYSWGLV